MFMAVPPRYDLINRLFTWGLDERWRRLTARECLKEQPKQVLDLCCGTADLALRLASMSSDSTSTMGIDFSLPMLEIARGKAERSGMNDRVTLVHGDTATLPFRDGQLIRKLFHIYMRWYVSRLGHLLSGNRGAYRYLAESASRFYTVEEIRNLMLEVGFSKFSSRRLVFGAAAIHVATK
jgi:demethylmenaquinone methyltransferase/2-methoxy-6-polyprenyl-1,4-benzoquinol methylase